MFSTTTVPEVILTVIRDFSLVTGGMFLAIFGLYTALVGLGWGKQKFEEHVVGKESLDFANKRAVTQMENSKIIAKGNRSGTTDELLNYKD